MGRPRKALAKSSITPAPGTKRRCAIYTRKSSEEGLEQEFSSLDAQREACAAYIASQRHEGWVMLPTFYDDGGISGGTLERPALKQLLADIASGKVDLVVVYKVDRLTRSLSDFAKIVEVFDASGASFVSVTQQFNTATSMGRLTLNMLLSFAQFEREVTGERIRDKIAASKRKGMWMGGVVRCSICCRTDCIAVRSATAAQSSRDSMGRSYHLSYWRRMLIGTPLPPAISDTSSATSLELLIPVSLQRAGLKMRLLVPGERQQGRADPALVKLIARGHQLRDRLLREDVSAKDLSSRVGLSCSYVSRLIRLAYLAPDIVKAILDGRQPVGLTANRLVRDTRLPLDWAEQRRQLGFC